MHKIEIKWVVGWNTSISDQNIKTLIKDIGIIRSASKKVGWSEEGSRNDVTIRDCLFLSQNSSKSKKIS